uniref:Ig-like domain-containing protein n=1 Tax=Eptatretus burgeri TaxID=7764 RepID=A0A8C4Q2G2_EPTBU
MKVFLSIFSFNAAIQPLLTLRLSSTEYQAQEANNCAILGAKTLCVQSEVIGLWREAVNLTCQFNNLLNYNMRNLSVVWFRSYGESHTVVVYNSTTEYIHEEFRGRLNSQGDPSQGDGSLTVSELKMEDEGTYICVFEFFESSWLHWWRSLETAKFMIFEGNPTQLRVDVRPKILRVWKEFMKSSNSWRLFCKVEAKPEPNITWWNPKGLLVHLSEIPVSSNEQNELHKIIGSYNLTEEEPAGNYSCLVENQHGVAQEHVMFKGSVNHVPGILMAVVGWSIVLSLALIFALVLGFCIYRKKLEDIPLFTIIMCYTQPSTPESLALMGFGQASLISNARYPYHISVHLVSGGRFSTKVLIQLHYLSPPPLLSIAELST